jgi:hypothetical protein
VVRPTGTFGGLREKSMQMRGPKTNGKRDLDGDSRESGSVENP